MINSENPLDEVKRMFTDFLGTGDTAIGQPFDERIPIGLRELYKIHDSYQRIKPGNTLFCNQDALLLPGEIIGDPYFDFLVENQSCWKCETEMGQDNPAVYIHDAESIEIEGRQIIHHSLNEFLTTYALQELTFELNFNINRHIDFQSLFNSSLKVEELWMDKTYTWGDGNRYSFWLIEDRCLMMHCSIRYLGTNDKALFDRMSRLLAKG